MVGTYNYKNGGREYQRKGEPTPTNTYDFIGKAGKAVPYGVYDVGANTGWVNVGTDADTGMFRGRVDPPLVDHHRQPCLP